MLDRRAQVLAKPRKHSMTVDSRDHTPNRVRNSRDAHATARQVAGTDVAADAAPAARLAVVHALISKHPANRTIGF